MTEFTRQEVLQLTKLTSTQLSYLDKLELISPTKVGAIKRPTCLYSWTQVLALKAYARLRESCSLQSLREAITYLSEYHPEDLLRDKRLFASENKIYWVEDNEREISKTVLEIINGKTAQGLLPVTFTISDLISEIKKDNQNVIDLEQRIKRANSKVLQTA